MGNSELDFNLPKNLGNVSQKLKRDSDKRPLWVCSDGTIFLETSSKFYKPAYEFCIAIAEPESRLQQFHEYKITSASLYGAASAGLGTERIIKVLNLLCKSELPDDVIRSIRRNTLNVGKLKLYLKEGSVILEGDKARDISTILRLPDVKSAVEAHLSTKSLRMDSTKLVLVRQKCREISYPLVEEYDYKNDTTCPTLDIKLNPMAVLRPYQKRSVDKMFVKGKARSGVIVLPCGAGKSLTGVYAAVRLGKSVLCFANTSVSVEQWVYQFKQWSTLPERRIQGVTSDSKASEFNARADIMVTTYSMYGYTGHRSKDSEAIVKAIEGKEWGLVLMDEVHVVPAKNFRDAVARTKSHCKLGLTATLLREDDAINDLEFIIGPKLYEANWQDLVQAGYLASVTCYEILCTMHKDFLREYLQLFLVPGFGKDDKRAIQHTLYSANPYKLMACEHLIKFHESRNDKIIVFSDNLFALEKMGIMLKRHMIRGDTSHDERLHVLDMFKQAPGGFTLFLSKVGDTSLDLPEATVVIQISSQGASRRQEAQRLGRVLRPKIKSANGVMSGGYATFYSLVSQDTAEMLYATKRQQFLVNQGYTFNTFTNVPPPADQAGLLFADPEVQQQLLKEALRNKSDIPPPPPVQQQPRKRMHVNPLFKKRNQRR